MFDVCSGCEDMAKRFEITRLDVECISMLAWVIKNLSFLDLCISLCYDVGSGSVTCNVYNANNE